MRAAFAALLLTTLSACLGDTVEPVDVPDHLVGRYELVSVEEGPLPADIGYSLGFMQRTEMLAGFVEIEEDGRFLDVTRFRVYSPDESAYTDFADGSDGTIRLRDEGFIEFRPWGTSSYLMQYSEALDAPMLVQEWGAYTLRYVRVTTAVPAN